ncbi:MAG TPA: tetratricopeptide repeat protein [Gammaproteobacteria bacterium]|jgi:tetratricopeptide (TPR) repeat protein|nr:hypothetical protein [Chromatiales bacterium]MCP4926933.1 hypothetical protein [Gammaproteobacteria bacterium]MDP7297139.1 tetratricopeptide repeat protein [Gammaproteobacteria bacterium]MDP7660846.1 tetratricopeptide repeat protein [Gammaproteobacteria bacterium]HJP39378.1 tetratricopeptide repeat protein [Gammaproteobacteria bacterium]
MKRWAWVIPLLLALVVYTPAPWSELVWDDPIVFERQMVAFDSVEDVFFPPEGISQWSTDYYRPITLLSYILDMRLYSNVQASWLRLPGTKTTGVYLSEEQANGSNSFAVTSSLNAAQIAGLHFSNVLYHVLTTFFIWLLARRLFQHLPNGATGALMAAAIFAVHPIHTESVNWIAGRSDLLAAMFLVPSVTLALLWRDIGAKWALALAGVLYLLALMSKEVAIAALVIVPAVLFLTPPVRQIQADDPAQDKRVQPPLAFAFRANIMMWLTTAVVLIAVTGFYLVLRHTDGVAYGMPLDVPWLNYVSRLEKSVAYYLVKVLVPWPQSNHVAWDSSPGALVTNGVFMVAVGLLGLGIWLWRQRRDGLVLLAMIWFGATLAPSIAVAIRHIAGTPLAERYLYLPSAGLALLLGIACCQPYRGKWLKPAQWGVVLLVIAYAGATIERGIVWSNNLQLWTDTTEKVPGHGDPWNQLGITYLEKRDYPNALKSFRRAIDGLTGATGRSYAKHNIALIYQLQNDLENAKKYFSAALDENVDNPEVHYGLGVLYKTEAKSIKLDNGRPDQVIERLGMAATQFELAISLNPYHTLARWGLGSVLALQGESYEIKGDMQRTVAHYRSALTEINTLIAQDPSYEFRTEVLNTRAGLTAALRRLDK